MNLYKKQILKILYAHSGQTISRVELENEIKHIKKRAILLYINVKNGTLFAEEP